MCVCIPKTLLRVIGDRLVSSINFGDDRRFKHPSRSLGPLPSWRPHSSGDDPPAFARHKAYLYATSSEKCFKLGGGVTLQQSSIKYKSSQIVGTRSTVFSYRGDRICLTEFEWNGYLSHGRADTVVLSTLNSGYSGTEMSLGFQVIFSDYLLQWAASLYKDCGCSAFMFGHCLSLDVHEVSQL